jgi:hypothetical protein
LLLQFFVLSRAAPSLLAQLFALHARTRARPGGECKSASPTGADRCPHPRIKNRDNFPARVNSKKAKPLDFSRTICYVQDGLIGGFRANRHAIFDSTGHHTGREVQRRAISLRFSMSEGGL